MVCRALNGNGCFIHLFTTWKWGWGNDSIQGCWATKQDGARWEPFMPHPKQASSGQSLTSPALLLERTRGEPCLTWANWGRRGKEEAASTAWTQSVPIPRHTSWGSQTQLLSLSNVLHPLPRTFLPFHLVSLKPTLSFKLKPSPISSRKSPRSQSSWTRPGSFPQPGPLGAQLSHYWRWTGLGAQLGFTAE